ncbi:MAG TPA: His-Xaa-Ser system radical SAM maturase HxsC [Thermoanaerobaculia bacterium]|nr:His-Xaa-Ser system radical SAM maturase HxsC [Thermoanaerobaculia bacterium]
MGKVCRMAQPAERRGNYLLLLDEPFAPGGPKPDLSGYAGVVAGFGLPATLRASCGVPLVDGVTPLDHLRDEDVVALHPNGLVRTHFRVGSAHNFLFATARCNSYCLMCSQPPQRADDTARLREHLRLLELIDPATEQLGITGGEPTLLKDGLLLIVRRAKEQLPGTALHILSNGRLFYYGSFARELAAIGHPDLMIGVPLYSPLDAEHDYVVQEAGAFDQTVVGLQNLGRFGVPVEIRVVVHRQTFSRLRELGEFIYRNFAFVAQVVFMGLERTGFAVSNFADLWIDPWEYRKELGAATTFLALRGVEVGIYNLPLCLVPQELWRFCRRSISDWKNEYLPVCETCAVRRLCGGFFSSALPRALSQHILPIVSEPMSVGAVQTRSAG